MVRSVAERAFVPARHLLEEFGDMMILTNLVLVHIIGMLGTQVFWGANPRAPIGG